ncbi:sperm acrosome membrane-associated protein 4-like [Rhinatrema bivittatum]|uniref:sperm acrosome membrane-associated protein 4-like n=1 Tax=Rhinatrema bivittatum TaxID=194408 RepID=UPI00112BE44E|nr:sperm acrosome membrane-associated protein 4-like [Rhinatrema bivittatum]
MSHLTFLRLLLFCTPALCKNECHYCEITSTDCSSAQVSCKPDERCYTGTGSSWDMALLTAKGCIEKKNCGKEEEITYMGSQYVMYYKCCEGSLCNGARPARWRGGSSTVLGAGMVLALVAARL